jgi:NAD(P)-dependent dehydrogenase (short-subunit alcohol dehydrogenase family)
MEFDRNNNKEVIPLLGAGSMGTAIVRRIAAGRKILLGDISEAKLVEAQKNLQYSGYDVETMKVDALNKENVRDFAKKAAELGDVMYFIDSAGASPNQADPQHIIKLDLIATSYAVDAFGQVIARGGAGLVIASQTGYMGPNMDDETETILATTPTEKLKDLPQLQPDKIDNVGIAYIMSKRVNQLRVRTAAATTWGDRGARINTISPGVIVTPLAYDEFAAAGEGYQKMIDASPAKRTGSSDEIAAAGAFLLGADAAFITGTDLLIDGGVIAAMKSGRFQLGQ